MTDGTDEKLKNRNMLKSQLESILFIANKPLTVKELASLSDRSKEEVETCLAFLADEYNQTDRGIRLVELNNSFQLVTNSNNRQIIENFLKEELTGELTRPQLETLTIVCYRGPITKLELEQIRGVNCSIILRNLMIRGLVESVTDKKIGVAQYQITMDFMRHLGLNNLRELPDYDNLSKHESLEELLADDRIKTDVAVNTEILSESE
jgi:segregation and condensation protein B